MPVRPRSPCTTPGCPELSTQGGRCEVCRHLKRKLKRTRTRALYDYGALWPSRRLDFLLRHPRCVLCGRRADVPDHWPESRRQLQARGVLDPDEDRYLRPLCAACHNSETARNQPGGWHRDRG